MLTKISKEIGHDIKFHSIDCVLDDKFVHNNLTVRLVLELNNELHHYYLPVVDRGGLQNKPIVLACLYAKKGKNQ